MMMGIKKTFYNYLLGVQEDPGKWEKFRVVSTWVAIILLLVMVVLILDYKQDLDFLMEKAENVSYFCKFLFDGIIQ